MSLNRRRGRILGWEERAETMGRKPCCLKEGVNRGAWSVKEDQLLSNYINLHGEGQWRTLPQKAGIYIYIIANSFLFHFITYLLTLECAGFYG